MKESEEYPDRLFPVFSVSLSHWPLGGALESNWLKMFSESLFIAILIASTTLKKKTIEGLDRDKFPILVHRKHSSLLYSILLDNIKPTVH